MRKSHRSLRSRSIPEAVEEVEEIPVNEGSIQPPPRNPPRQPAERGRDRGRGRGRRRGRATQKAMTHEVGPRVREPPKRRMRSVEHLVEQSGSLLDSSTSVHS